MLLYTKTKILIIEEEEMFRTILVRYCQTWEYSVVGSCDNGRDGLIQSVRLKPDIVIINTELPVYDGLDVVDAIKKKVSGIKVMIITNAVTALDLVKALKVNADCILDKRTDSFDNIKKVIPDIRAGKKYFSPVIREKIRSLYPESVSVGTL